VLFLDSTVFENASVFEIHRWPRGAELNDFGTRQINFFISRLDEEKADEGNADMSPMVCGLLV